MTDVTAITDGLLEKARAQAADIAEECARTTEKMQREAEEERKRIRAEHDAKLSEETDKIYRAKEAEKKLAKQDAEEKALVLSIKTAVRDAFEKICGDEDVYWEFIEKLIKETDLTKVDTVFLNAKDRKRICEKIFYPARVSDDVIKTAGGFKAVGKEVIFDMTMEAIAEERKRELYKRECNALTGGSR